MKYDEWANFTPDDIPEHDAVIDRLIQLTFDPDLLKALWIRCKMPFPTRKKQIAIFICESVVFTGCPFISFGLNRY